MKFNRRTDLLLAAGPCNVGGANLVEPSASLKAIPTVSKNEMGHELIANEIIKWFQ